MSDHREQSTRSTSWRSLRPATSTAIATNPGSKPEYDEQDDEQDAWMASIVEESKESGTDNPTETPNETNQEVDFSQEPQVSGADTMAVPQGDQHTTMSASTAIVVDGSPTAVQGTNRYNLPPVSDNYSSTEYRERSQLVIRARVLEAEAEVESLQTELTRPQQRADQLSLVGLSSFIRRMRLLILFQKLTSGRGSRVASVE